MKIKAVCEYTGLTDRAIRFYVEKGLITPESIILNDRTYYEYGEEEVELLKIIVILRRSGFSIEEILRMKTNPKEITDTLKYRSEELSKEAQGVKEMARKLEEARRKRPEGFADIYDLAEEIRREELLEGKDDTAQKAAVRKLPELKLEFGKFDPETEEEKEKMYEEFLGKQYVRNKMREPFEKMGWALRNLTPAFIRKPLGQFFHKMGWGAGKIFMIFLSMMAVMIFVIGLFMMIPRSLTGFCPSEKMEQKEIGVNYGNWEMSEFSEWDYISDMGTFMEGSEGYERLKGLLKRTKYSGFIQSLFPRNTYSVSGADKNIMLNVGWRDNGEWKWQTMHVYNNGIMLVDSGSGWRIFYLDWFGREDCDRFFEEVKAVLEECESE